MFSTFSKAVFDIRLFHYVFWSIQKVLVCLSLWSDCEAIFRFELADIIISKDGQKYTQSSISLKEN